MKNAKKILSLLLCAVLLVGATIAGTVAYLTDDASVKNTFTIGNVEITMEETLVDEYGVPLTGDAAGTTDEGNKYKLIPGHTYTKDPTIDLTTTSEDCYIFVEIANGLGADAELVMSDSWAKVNGDINGTSVWVYGTLENPTVVSVADEAVVPFNAFTFGDDANPADYEDSTITVTAYAIQADTLNEESATDLWALLSA